MKNLLLFLSVLFFASCNNEQAKPIVQKVDKQSIFDLLTKDSAVVIDLLADIDSLILTKDEEKVYPATLSFLDKSGTKFSEEIKIEARGKTRKSICASPPLRFLFSTPLLKKHDLANYTELKMVTPCKENMASEDLVIKELLCYQLYRELTDNSFRAQPAKLKITQKGRTQANPEQVAFFIEPKEEMARSLGGELLDETVTKIKTIDIKSYNLLVLFQYMIGNTDWNLARRHNIKLVKVEGKSAPIPVPYDFDYSGLVNAEYAVPHPNLPIKNIRDRFFQWKGKDTEILKEPIATLIKKKPALFNLLENCQMKDQKEKRSMIDYVKAFYEIIESEDVMDILTKK